MKKKILTQITLYNDSIEKYKTLSEKINTDITDLLVIDDGSENEIFDEIETGTHIKCIRHEMTLGYGSSFLNALNYASDNGYDVLISLDSDSDEAAYDIQNLLENINYGYDIVNCSRILENYEYRSIPDVIQDRIKLLSDAISSSTGYDITDPLSLTKAVNIASLKDMEFVESGLGLFLQLFIQASSSGLTMIEVPLFAKCSFKKESRETDTPEDYLILMETENFLFKKGNIN